MQEYHRYQEYRVRMATGEIGYLAVRFVRYRNEQEDIVKTIGVNQDITERKLAELALKENEISLQKAFEIGAIGPCKYSLYRKTYRFQ